MRHTIAVAATSLLVLCSFNPPHSSGQAADAVNKAIDRGVIALTKSLKGVRRGENQSSATARGHLLLGSGENDIQLGVTALAVLTVLECGVAADDPAVQKQLPTLRKGCVTATHTYTLALLIVVLDRLKDADDVPLIQSMGMRLLAGQYYADGWAYRCPAPTREMEKRLKKVIEDRPPAGSERKLEGKPEPPLPGDYDADLKQLIRMRVDVAPAAGNFQGRGDNSNTQFAVFGLWTARRYGIQITPALAAVETRFRKSQRPDGGWGYVPALRGEATKDTGTSPSMTCAALMVLGMCYALASENAAKANPKPELPDMTRDPVLRGGFAYLASGIGQQLVQRGRMMPGQGLIQTGYYYLWSVERVGVGYNLRLLGNRDWYAWGATQLLNSQEADGTWQYEYGAVVDTCFALLFLKRVNLFMDLSDGLKGLESFGEAGGKK